MSKSIDITVPDIGDFNNIEVIEVHIAPGDEIQLEDALITLESDKASMDVPAPMAGSVTDVYVKPGDRVSEGSPIIALIPAEQPGAVESPEIATAPTPVASGQVTTAPAPAQTIIKTDSTTGLLVIGAGPGGYSAAFRAADLGLDVTLVERHASLGGVCLNVGCIPSKALLHAAKVISEADSMAKHGIRFSSPEIDIDALRKWKEGIVKKLTGGLKGLARQRKVKVVQGLARFNSDHSVCITADDGSETTLGFEQAIIAVGSSSIRIPGLPDDPRIFDSTGALALTNIPARLLVIGGGIIGLEMATVYHQLGSQITVVEMQQQLIPGADADLVKPLARMVSKQFERVLTGTRVEKVTAGDSLNVSVSSDKGTQEMQFDAILVAVGRSPNAGTLNAEAAGIAIDGQGFISVNKQQRSNIPHIFAIGDVVGQPMLAHKAVHEGKVAAEVAAGQKSSFDVTVIPSVAYTDPEVAWVGLTELEAKAAGTRYETGVFPWAASGRSLSLGRNEGLTKLLFDPDSKRLLGAGIVGPGAGELIAEVALAIEMGADAEDIALTIHPHPTLSETVAMAAEAFEGTITDLYMPKK
jgi:dihydrolipoamide dehydrogenase